MSLKIPRLVRSGGAALILLMGCGPSLEAQTQEHDTALAAPSAADFPAVSDALEVSCGTLDCHGQVGRNFRIYGAGGLRLSAADKPGGDPTTDLEYLSTYVSLVSLEPETLAQVVTLQADPNQLSLVRKTRGIEHHKGGQRARTGDSLDRCIVLWLIGKSDPDSCAEVVNAPRPNSQ